jgi:nitroreductase/NAD-dependent dihydropyrimidine dehydrogenase PreA subunit
MAHLRIDSEKCERDGICVAECPARILTLPDEDSVPELIPGGEELCINCGHCVAVCPHAALSLHSMNSEQCPPIRKALLPGFEQIDHFLRARRSIRSFQARAVDREILLKLIDTARYAPSGHNLQPVHWLVIQDSDEVHRLAGIVANWMRWVIEHEPALAETMRLDVVVSLWESGIDRILRSAPHLAVAHGLAELRVTQSSCFIALAYLELAAFAHGLGACWAGYFAAAAASFGPMQDALSLPEGHCTVGAMMLGHPTYAYHRIPLRNEPRIVWR